MNMTFLLLLLLLLRKSTKVSRLWGTIEALPRQQRRLTTLLRLVPHQANAPNCLLLHLEPSKLLARRFRENGQRIRHQCPLDTVQSKKLRLRHAALRMWIDTKEVPVIYKKLAAAMKVNVTKRIGKPKVILLLPLPQNNTLLLLLQLEAAEILVTSYTQRTQCSR
jgi:hypothetical protein